MKKVCVVTGTRAEYGLLKPLIRKINDDSHLELVLAVTGMHLSNEFGNTVNEIISDGFSINKQVEMLLSADTPSGIVKSMGVELIGLADFFKETSVDILIVLGDRYEIFIAAAAAMMFKIPIAHIHGGELTEGLVDEAIRHSITKMSMIHFAATETYRNRIIQLGEHPRNVFFTGALGVESIHKLKLLSREDLKKETGAEFDAKVIMVTYHPVTLENNTAQSQFRNLLNVLDKRKEFTYIFTKANADMDGRIINEMIDQFVSKQPERCYCFTSMGQLRYLSALQFCYFVIGNSSSGIIEAPSFHIPTINIGDRQKGRVHADTVIDCGTSECEIEEAVKLAMCGKFRSKLSDCSNPYFKENTSEEMILQIKHFLNQENSLKKHFYDV